jgi:alkylated DNA repair dioxygenase AlkB
VGNGEECEERLDDGDLLVMGGTMQQVRENGERGRERKTDREREIAERESE